jgi:deazaflavin-dependent oxidoreductase (nitroreductase family)
MAIHEFEPRPDRGSDGATARPDEGTPVSQGVTGVRRSAFRLGTRLFNPLLRRLAGTRALPLFGVIHHRGRRSGRPYATPVAVAPTADGFIVPLTFGQGADWFRNVRAAGGCMIRWKGADYPVVEPEVVDFQTGRSAITPLERRLLPVFGIRQFVHLRHAAPGGRP